MSQNAFYSNFWGISVGFYAARYINVALCPPQLVSPIRPFDETSVSKDHDDGGGGDNDGDESEQWR